MLEKLTNLNNLLTIADKIVISCIILCSLFLIAATPHLAAEGGEKDVVITLADQEIYRYNLANNDDLRRIKFSFTYQGTEYQGFLRMKDSKVKLERLSKDISPLAIHAEMGWISEPYQMIVCLPIKLTVTIESDKPKQNDIDLRTF